MTRTAGLRRSGWPRPARAAAWSCGLAAALGAAWLVVSTRADPGAECIRATDEARYADAVLACRAAMDTDPDPVVALRHARALHQAGELEAAREAAQRLVDTPVAGAAWRLLGRVAEREGQAEAARAAFEHAKASHLAEGDLREAAYDAHALAGSHWRQTRNAEALAALLQARALADQAGDARLAGIVLQGVGALLAQVGADAAAAQALSDADGRLTRFALDRAPVAHARGILARDNQEVGQCAMRFEEAAALAREAGSVRIERTATANLAFCALLRGTAGLDEGRRHLARAFELSDRDADRSELAYLHLIRAQERRLSGAFAEAVAALDAADAAAPLPDLVWCVDFERGRVELARGHLAAAEDALLRAIAHIQDLRRSMGLDLLKRGFFSNHRAPFEALFLLRHRQGRDRDAAALAESVLGRAFLDAFGRTAPTTGATPSGAVTADVEADWARAVARDADWRRLVPELVASGIAKPRAPTDLASTLGGRTVLAYFEAEGAGHLIAYGPHQPGGVRVVDLPASASEIATLAAAASATPDAPAATEALSAALALPALLPPAGTPVYLVPDGPLVGVPFAALPVAPGGPPLIAEHDLVLAPSVTGLASLLARPRPAETGAPLVLGDPGGDLPGARAEAVEVAARLGVPPRLGPEATLDALRAARGAPLIHVAGHAGLDVGGPWLSLSDARPGIGELVHAGLHPELVVLASCASGATLERELWGSLAAAFLAGGAGNVLATARSVDDAVTHRLIRALYAHAPERGPAAALSAAQRDLAKTEPPSRWAHFFVVGRGDVSTNTENREIRPNRPPALAADRKRVHGRP